MTIDDLADYGLPQNVLQQYREHGIVSLYPPQEEALHKGVLEGRNLLMAVPTAAGKTLIAELTMMRAFFQGQRSLYIVPLKALASEKFRTFEERFQSLGVRVGLATGDSPQGASPAAADILVATAEKVDAILRFDEGRLIRGLGVMVADEIHFLNDDARGPTLEILITRIRQLNPDLQCLGLSATVVNAEELAAWIEAEPVISSWRPIPLKEGVALNRAVYFAGGGQRLLDAETPDELCALIQDTLKGKGQALVFVNSRRASQSAARLLAPWTRPYLSETERSQLRDLSRKLCPRGRETTRICRQLAETVLKGCAFHHAGLRSEQREAVEAAFKQNRIKVICATPTLAAGVNLPARRVVVRDTRRFEAGLGSARIPVSEYKQCAGRAGRPGYDTEGESVLIAKSPGEKRTLMKRYIQGEPEPIHSRLNQESALRTHILAGIAGGFLHDIEEILHFLSATLMARQNRLPALLQAIEGILSFLESEQLIRKQGYDVTATDFGRLVSRLYLDPVSGIRLRSGLTSLTERRQAEDPFVLLHLLACCPDGPGLHALPSDSSTIETLESLFKDRWLITEEKAPELDNPFLHKTILHTAHLLLNWIEEAREDVLCEQFPVGPGDIYRLQESARRLAYAATALANGLGMKTAIAPFFTLEKRLRAGVKEELLDWVSLKGIGRVRGRQLFNHGWKSPRDLQKENAETISQLPGFSRTLARQILEQCQLRESAASPK